MANNGRGHRLCFKCKKPYYRSNRVRVWTAQNFGHRTGWVKLDEPICCKCMNAHEAQSVLKDIIPKWRPLKPEEKVAAVTVKRSDS